MKKTTLLFICVMMLHALIIGQENNSNNQNTKTNLSFGVSAFYTPILSTELVGIENYLRVYLTKKLSMGYIISATERKISNTYEFDIQEPLVEFYEFGWVNQYDVLQFKRIRLGTNINNGILISRLGDNSSKENMWTQYGCVERSKKIATNYYYLLEPGLAFSILLFTRENWPGFYFIGSAKYRFAFGNGKYGSVDDFSNYYMSIGLSIEGL